MTPSRALRRSLRAKGSGRTRQLRAVPSSVPVFRLGHGGMTVESVVRVARGSARLLLPRAIEGELSRTHQAMAVLVRAGHPVYGWNTGVGPLDGQRITRKENRLHQRRLLRSHAAGVGAPLPPEQVRAMMFVRANMLALARSGARPALVRGLVALLARDVVPWVPMRGSVGAADLAPLAHVGLVLLGEGRAWVGGRLVPGAEALAAVGLRPIELAGRDALALMNGLAYSVGLGALVAHGTERLIEAAEVAAALSIAATGSPGPQFEEALVEARPHPGVRASAEHMRALLSGSSSAPGFREPLSSRCVHQVLGAAREALCVGRRIVETEINASSDNPAPGADGRPSANASTFDGHVLAHALEHLATSLSSVAIMGERRIARLLEADRLRGHPAFLAASQLGFSSGLMLVQYTAAALVAELRARSVPSSIQSLSTGAGTEDLVSMSPLSARRAAFVLEAVEQVVALELLAAAQAADLRGGAPLPELLAEAHRRIRAHVPPLQEDRPLHDDVTALTTLIRNGSLVSDG